MLFRENYSAAIIGTNGGIGAALRKLLLQDPKLNALYSFSRHDEDIFLDITDEENIENAAKALAEVKDLKLILITTGLLHSADGLSPEKDWRYLNRVNFERSFLVNVIGPALIAKHFAPLLPKAEKSIFAALSARVSSISDNRSGGWYAYRASKAALNQVIRTLSIEAARKKPHSIFVGIHPGTVDTSLSAPFQSGVPANKIFKPEFSAEKIVQVLSSLNLEDSGGLFAWNGEKIPF